MNLTKTIAVLILVVAAYDVTSAQRSSRVNRLFSRFFDSARRAQPKATCDWLKNPSLLKELKWTEKVDLCFETGPRFQYPANDVETALRNDPAAMEFLTYLTQCYSFQNQSYYRPWNQRLYTQDLCPVRAATVDKVWRYNHIDRRNDHCYLVHPAMQRVDMAQCGDGLGHPDSQKCKMDETSYFRGNYYCVPDGYVKRTVLVYCPWDPEVQCSPAQVRIPTGCSCKQYTCDKTRVMSGAPLSSLTSRFTG
ncbi:hypothetical protein ACOMHN_056047 [Nucella lapillus]